MVCPASGSHNVQSNLKRVEPSVVTYYGSMVRASELLGWCHHLVWLDGLEEVLCDMSSMLILMDGYCKAKQVIKHCSYPDEYWAKCRFLTSDVWHYWRLAFIYLGTCAQGQVFNMIHYSGFLWNLCWAAYHKIFDPLIDQSFLKAFTAGCSKWKALGTIW